MAAKKKATTKRATTKEKEAVVERKRLKWQQIFEDSLKNLDADFRRRAAERVQHAMLVDSALPVDWGAQSNAPTRLTTLDGGKTAFVGGASLAFTGGDKMEEPRSNVRTHLDDLQRALAYLDDVTSRLTMKLEAVLSSNNPTPPTPSGDIAPVPSVGCEMSANIRSAVAHVDELRARVQDVLNRLQV